MLFKKMLSEGKSASGQVYDYSQAGIINFLWPMQCDRRYRPFSKPNRFRKWFWRNRYTW